MEKKLLKQFDVIETQRKQLLQRIAALTDEQLNKIPSEDQWSINQVIFHVILAEELSYKSIKTKVISSKGFQKASVISFVRSTLLKLILRSPRKFKAPAVVSQPPVKSDLSELIAKWDEVRLLLKELLESLPPHLLNKYIYKHPVAGKMSIYGGLDFMYEHVRRHHIQIDKMVQNFYKFQK